MNCFTSGLVGFAFVGASIATMLGCRQQTDKLRGVLSEEAAAAYEKIIKERTNQYIQGLLIGIVLSYVVLLNIKINNRFHKISVFFAITLLTTVMYYMLMPKSDWMLNHLKTEDETKAWLEVYKNMKARYFVGFVLGALAAVPLGNSLC
jgi:glycerol uptake facilitator-like aquaporin